MPAGRLIFAASLVQTRGRRECRVSGAGEDASLHAAGGCHRWAEDRARRKWPWVTPSRPLCSAELTTAMVGMLVGAWAAGCSACCPSERRPNSIFGGNTRWRCTAGSGFTGQTGGQHTATGAGCADVLGVGALHAIHTVSCRPCFRPCRAVIGVVGAPDGGSLDPPGMPAEAAREKRLR